MAEIDKKILCTSIELLNEKGVNKFSVRALARVMNLSMSTLYRNVKGKSDIYSMICEYVCENIGEREFYFYPDAKSYLLDILSSLRRELLQIRHSAAIFLETVPSRPKHMELKPKIMKALASMGVSESQQFTLTCTLINYVLSNVNDEEFYRDVSFAIEPGGIIGFYKNQVKNMDYDKQFLDGLELLLKNK